MSFIVIFCSKGDTLGVSYILSRWDSAIKHRPKYLGSTSLHTFHWGLRDNRSISYGGLHIQSNRSASRFSEVQRLWNLKNDAAHRKTSPSVRCSTFHLATLMVKGCDLLLDRESCKMEYKHPILKNEHLANLKHPQSSIEPPNRREPDDYRSSVNTRSAIIKVKLLFSGSTSQRMEKEHLTKLTPAS